eukprot:6201813-Pleurochrysis_carterae.AAC.5
MSKAGGCALELALVCDDTISSATGAALAVYWTGVCAYSVLRTYETQLARMCIDTLGHVSHLLLGAAHIVCLSRASVP